MEYVLLFRKRRPETAPPTPSASDPPLQAPPVAYVIDWFWCDAFGMYFRGWLHGYDRKIESLAIRIGEDTATVGSFQERLDLPPRHPGFAVSKDCGFEIIAANMTTPVHMYPQVRIEGLLPLPLNPGYAESCILARKVAEMPPRGERIKPDLNERARQYPLRETP
jgi:hypothetical protein